MENESHSSTGQFGFRSCFFSNQASALLLLFLQHYKACPSETIIRFRVLIPSVSNMTNNSSDKTSKYAGQWADLLADLFDKLTGKEAEVTYTFDNLEINVPEAVGPDGKTLGSAKWTINGKILIKAEAHRTV
jgi:hypothetical protein